MEIAEIPAAPAATKKNPGSNVPLAGTAAQSAQFDALFAFDSSAMPGAPTAVREPNTGNAHGIGDHGIAPPDEFTVGPGKQNKKISSTASIESLDAILAFPAAQASVTLPSIGVQISTTSKNCSGVLLDAAGAELQIEGERARAHFLAIPEPFSSGASALSIPAGATGDKAETPVGDIFNAPETPPEGAIAVNSASDGADKSLLDSASYSTRDDLKALALDEPSGRHETAARSTDKIQLTTAPVDLIASRPIEIGGSTSSTPARLESFSAAHSNTAFLVLSSNSVDESSFELRLDPPELGSVRIEIKHLDNGALRAIVSAERLETLDLLRRHIDIFRAEVSELGFGELDLHFASHEQGDGASSSKEKPGADAARRSFDFGFDVNSSQSAPLSGSMDIWV